MRVPCELPAAAERFIGRGAQRQRLTERLRAGLNTTVVGEAGIGKTALLAEVLRDVVGEQGERLGESKFRDGIIYLNLPFVRGRLDTAWHTLANRICGVDFLERRPAKERAKEACRGRRILLVIESGESADDIAEFLTVLAPENRRLVLTRLETHATPAENIPVRDGLIDSEAEALLETLSVSGRALVGLLGGHPLAIQWAAGLLSSTGEDAAALAQDWRSAEIPSIQDVQNRDYTLRWLFKQSALGLSETARRTLSAAGRLALLPFASEAMQAAGGTVEGLTELAQRRFLRRLADGEWEFAHGVGYQFARSEGAPAREAKQRLAAWLRGKIEECLTGKTDSLDNLLQHADAVLSTDSEQVLWTPLAESLLYEIPDRLEELVRYDLSSLALGSVSRWFQLLAPDKAEEPAWQRELSVSHTKIGNAFIAQGELSRARAAYGDALALSQKLAQAEPWNTARQRDLSVSHNKTGDALLEQGDLAGALGAYRASLGIRLNLADAEPENVRYQRDLSVSHSKIGDVLLAQNDVRGALSSYREDLAVSQRLAEADPANVRWQRDLSVSHHKIGEVLLAQGDVRGASAAFREDLAVIQQLLKAEPENIEWQRDFSVTQEKLGDVLFQLGDRTAALTAYNDALAVKQRLEGSEPSEAGLLEGTTRVRKRGAGA